MPYCIWALSELGIKTRQPCRFYLSGLSGKAGLTPPTEGVYFPLPRCTIKSVICDRHGPILSLNPPSISMPQSRELAPKENQPDLPVILAGNATAAVRNRVEGFFSSLASIFESWVRRRQSLNTQRAYREDVMAFVKFMGLTWPNEATQLLRVSVQDVQRFRGQLFARNAAPKTLNRRISSLSSFYKYLAAAAAELRLPIMVPNPAHAQFISRESTDPREETRALSAARARQLVGLPAGNSVLDYRDRAILKFFLYSGARLSTACRLKVSDFHQDGDEATIRLHEKGDKRRTIGLHFQAAQAIVEYIEKAGLMSGSLFRPRLNSRSQKLGSSGMSAWTLWRVVEDYLVQLPGGVKEEQLPDDSIARQAVYTPHSIRATTATLLLDAGVDIIKVKELLGHSHITTTQIYDKRRRSTSESASHLLAI